MDMYGCYNRKELHRLYGNGAGRDEGRGRGRRGWVGKERTADGCQNTKRKGWGNGE